MCLCKPVLHFIYKFISIYGHLRCFPSIFFVYRYQLIWWDFFINTCLCLCMFNCIQFFVPPWTVAHQGPLSKKFSSQEYWSGLPFPSPGDLLHPGIKSRSLTSPALAGRFFTSWANSEALTHGNYFYFVKINIYSINI